MHNDKNDRVLSDESLDEATGGGRAMLKTSSGGNAEQLQVKRTKAAAKMMAPTPGIEGTDIGSGG